MKNLVKSKIEAGDHPLGTFFQTGSETTAEVLGHAGLDYYIVDTEHGPFSAESAAGFIRAGKFAGTTPFVRVKDSSRSAIMKALDAGAAGVIVPNVRSLDEAKQIVMHGKYFPLGGRGIAATPGTGYWQQAWARSGLDRYMAISNAETMLIPQCETAGCLREIEEIAALDGIDGIFVGPFDLSAALGRPGDFGNPDQIAAIDRVLKACQAVGKASFIFSTTIDDARQRYEQGFDSVAYSVDSVLLMDAVRGLVKQLGEAN